MNGTCFCRRQLLAALLQPSRMLCWRPITRKTRLADVLDMDAKKKKERFIVCKQTVMNYFMCGVSTAEEMSSIESGLEPVEADVKVRKHKTVEYDRCATCVVRCSLSGIQCGAELALGGHLFFRA